MKTLAMWLALALVLGWVGWNIEPERPNRMHYWTGEPLFIEKGDILVIPFGKVGYPVTMPESVTVSKVEIDNKDWIMFYDQSNYYGWEIRESKSSWADGNTL